MRPAFLPLRLSRQRGVTLIEALVALMVMSFGMVALVELMGNLRRSGDIAKQRSEAMRLAQQDVSTLRAFSTLNKPASAASTVSDYVGDIVTATPATVTLTDSNTTFTVQRNVLNSATGALFKSVQVVVSWQDRASRASDAAQTLVLNSIIARVDPAFAGAVGIAPAPGGTRQPQDRHSAIPPAAADLGNKTSAFRPGSLSDRVWIFNNVTGFITRICDIAPATVLTAASVSAATTCSDTLAFLLSGTINFSNTNPASPNAPEATALPLDMTITGGSFVAPRRNSDGVLERDGAGDLYMDTVTAIAPTFQCFDDAPSVAPSTQAFINYSCIVYPSGTVRPNWSGSLQLTGLSIGTSASQYRVCRYSADYNGNGNAYANADRDIDNYEHPAVYAQVTGSLPRQNFLVVKGDVSCPTAPAVNLSTGVFADYSTYQLQPSPSP